MRYLYVTVVLLLGCGSTSTIEHPVDAEPPELDAGPDAMQPADAGAEDAAAPCVPSECLGDLDPECVHVACDPSDQCAYRFVLGAPCGLPDGGAGACGDAGLCE